MSRIITNSAGSRYFEVAFDSFDWLRTRTVRYDWALLTFVSVCTCLVYLRGRNISMVDSSDLCCRIINFVGVDVMLLTWYSVNFGHSLSIASWRCDSRIHFVIPEGYRSSRSSNCLAVLSQSSVEYSSTYFTKSSILISGNSTQFNPCFTIYSWEHVRQNVHELRRAINKSWNRVKLGLRKWISSTCYSASLEFAAEFLATSHHQSRIGDHGINTNLIQKWGFKRPNHLIVNCRSESFTMAPFLNINKNRCIVIAQGYYKWRCNINNKARYKRYDS